jgi:hypothetical protein
MGGGDSNGEHQGGIGNVSEKGEQTGKLARPRRFERPTFAFGGQRSIQLSYGRACVLNRRNAPKRQRALFCSLGMCVKVPAAKVGRSNRLGRQSSSRAASVPSRSFPVFYGSGNALSSANLISGYRDLSFGGMSAFGGKADMSLCGKSAFAVVIRG